MRYLIVNVVAISERDLASWGDEAIPGTFELKGGGGRGNGRD